MLSTKSPLSCKKIQNHLALFDDLQSENILKKALLEQEVIPPRLY